MVDYAGKIIYSNLFSGQTRWLDHKPFQKRLERKRLDCVINRHNGCGSMLEGIESYIADNFYGDI